MNENKNDVTLGFISDKVPAGTHVCLIYNTEKDRVDSLLKFLLSGMESGEKAICYSERMDEHTVREFFGKNSLSYDEHKEKNAITLAGVSEVYFKNNVFDPERMLNNLKSFYKESKDKNFKGARVIGEMLPEIEKIAGGERLLEYESRVTVLLRDYPATTVCQYNANDFDGATIMDILKVHPRLIVNGAIVQNPLYIPAEDFLSENQKL